jgi:Tfp pilus assembly protein PilO
MKAKANLQAAGFITPVLLLVVSGMAIAFYHLPKNTQIQKTKKEIQAFNLKLKKDIPEAAILSAKLQIDTIAAALEKRRVRVYPMERLLGIGSTIQSFIGGYDLTLVTLKPQYDRLAGLEQDTTDISELPITIAVKGRFSSITRLLDNLAGLPFAMNVNGISMIREDRESSVIDVEFNGIVFFSKNRAGAGRIPQSTDSSATGR